MIHLIYLNYNLNMLFQIKVDKHYDNHLNSKIFRIIFVYNTITSKYIYIHPIFSETIIST